MRADVNVSVRKPGEEFGTRTETKNVNSVRFVMAVIEHEARRQVDLIEEGGEVAQETRLYDPDKNVTRTLRSKEDAHDYRYFPDPDLLPLELDDAFLEQCRASIPELPDAKRSRYEQMGISAYNASVLTAEVETAGWFDALLSNDVDPLGQGLRVVSAGAVDGSATVSVNADGSAGALVPIETSLPLGRPDGLRSAGGMKLIQAEQQGRVAELTISGNRAEVRVLKDSLPRAAGVTLVGDSAWVLVDFTKAVVVPYESR